MNIEVLLSCMNHHDITEILSTSNIKSNAIVINQCDKNEHVEYELDGNKVKIICSDQRGLTKSRNLALTNASAEIGVLCDDDVVYEDNYEEIITDAFRELKDADIIIFNIERLNYKRNIEPIMRVRKAPWYKSYGSVRIAFRLKSIKQNNIWFDMNFGAGSVYGSGEETLMLREARKKKLNIYEYPANIAKVDFADSTWFEGYNEKFFYDKGALLSAAYPLMKHLFMFHYIKILRKSTKLSPSSIFKWITIGMKEYKNLNSYDEYVVKNVRSMRMN